MQKPTKNGSNRHHRTKARQYLQCNWPVAAPFEETVDFCVVKKIAYASKLVGLLEKQQ